MDYYSIKFQRKIDTEKQEWLGNKKEFNIVMKQLKNLAVSLNGIVIKGINDLEYFSIENRNYAYKKGNDYYINYNSIDHDTGEIIKYISIYDMSKLTNDFEIFENFQEENKDITNESLYKYGISGDDYKKIGKVLFENGILWVNANKFKLTKGDKIYELFDTIFRAKSYYNKISFTYDELKIIYKNNSIEYNKLEAYDISNFSINDIVGKKMITIKSKTNMKDKILKITTNKISIWQETAL